MKYFSLLIFIFLFTQAARGGELFEVHSNARAMGMGGAFISIVDNEEALWYNPAGIARNGGFFWTIADPKVGLSDPEVLTNLSDLGDAATFEATMNSLYGEPIWLGASAKTAFMAPYFAAAYFYDVDTSIIVDNPVAPNITTNAITDTGYAIGTGWTMGGLLEMGFAAKYITRTGIRKNWGAQTVASIIAGDSTPDVIFDSITNVNGTGYSFDFGMNITAPTIVQPSVSFVWKNIGDTKFRAALGEEAPPTEEQDMIVGGSLLVALPLVHIVPAFEVRRINDADVQLPKKIHMGVEIGLPMINIRAGLYQGYYTLGAGVNLGPVEIDAATWGTELGDSPGQFEGRRYMVQATLRMGFDFGLGGGSPRSASARASSSGGGSGGRSFFGSKKPKVRR